MCCGLRVQLFQREDGIGEARAALVLDGRIVRARILPDDAGPQPGLIARAQGSGFKVHPWTVRLENSFLPAGLRRGEAPAAHGDAETLFRALFPAGVEGVFH